MVELSQKKCVACEGDVPPLNRIETEVLLQQLNTWILSADARKIARGFTFKNFADAMVFANHIADIAEKEGHHPDLTIGWGKVGVELTTHAIEGLSENDFIVAAKIDRLMQ